MSDGDKTADVVIIGAGIAGLSVARALVEKQAIKVIVVDMEAVYGYGSTGKAAGSIRRQLQTETLTRIADKSTRDLATFEERYGVDITCEIPGYLNLANTEESKKRLLEEDKIHKKIGLTTEILDPEEIGKRWDFLETRDLLVGTFSPLDLNIDPFSVATALYKGARKGGAAFLFNTKATGIIRAGNGAVTGIETTRGTIQAPVIVNAAGPWAADMCMEAGMNGRPPIDPKRRQIWQVGKGIAVPREIPFIMDVDAPFYMRPYRELFLLSLMEEDEVKLVGNEPPFDWEWIFKIEDRVKNRVPALENADIAKGWAGWRTLTPDDAPVIGKVESVPGFYLAAGFGGHGLALAPFCGFLVASSILGETSSDTVPEELNINRLL